MVIRILCQCQVQNQNNYEFNLGAFVLFLSIFLAQAFHDAHQRQGGRADSEANAFPVGPLWYLRVPSRLVQIGSKEDVITCNYL